MAPRRKSLFASSGDANSSIADIPLEERSYKHFFPTIKPQTKFEICLTDNPIAPIVSTLSKPLPLPVFSVLEGRNQSPVDTVNSSYCEYIQPTQDQLNEMVEYDMDRIGF
jgi:hypothetical protein